jgi:hypothetical protein
MEVTIQLDPLEIRDDSLFKDVVKQLNAVIKRVYGNNEENFGYGMTPIADTAKWYDFANRFLIVFCVAGASEGHYIHVESLQGSMQKHRMSETRNILLAKTFNGFERAQEIVRLVQFLLTNGTGTG